MAALGVLALLLLAGGPQRAAGEEGARGDATGIPWARSFEDAHAEAVRARRILMLKPLGGRAGSAW